MIYFKLIIQNKTCLTHHLPRWVQGPGSNIGRVNGEHNIVTLEPCVGSENTEGCKSHFLLDAGQL